MEAETLAQDKWKSARDFGTTTTQIAVVLFAALIASWLGMWDNVAKYRSAVESQQWLEKHARLAQNSSEQALKDAIRNRLKFELATQFLDENEEQGGKKSEESDEKKEFRRTRREELDRLLVAVDRDPNTALKSSAKGDWTIPLLATAIRDEAGILSRQRSSARQAYNQHRARAEKTPFKLLGLEFSVNGFWAWAVWLVFFCGGVLYVSLARRALIRRCRSIWLMLSQGANFSAEDARLMADTLPVWVRPLPTAEPWVAVLTNRLRLDAMLDPLSVLCIALMAACTILSVLVLWMGVMSTSLVRVQSNLEPQPFSHATALCVLYALSLGLLVGWRGMPNDSRCRWYGKRKGELRPKVELLSRRTWVVAALCAAATALAYADPINKRLSGLLLRNPRFRRPSSRRRPGDRAQDAMKHQITGPWATGFHQDTNGQIHFVPASGRARSLFKSVPTEVQPWNGPFNSSMIQAVHPSAMVPFLRQAVRTQLAGVMHRKTAKERAAVLANPATLPQYQKAFDLVRQGIVVDAARRRHPRMPNLQLYDLLGVIAINSNSKPLLGQARQLLRDASLQPREPIPGPTKPARTEESLQDGHSHHSARKRRSDYYERRTRRLESFKKQRLEQQFLPPLAVRQVAKDGSRGRKGTWDVAFLTSDEANFQQVARKRKKERHRKRIHREKGVRWS